LVKMSQTPSQNPLLFKPSVLTEIGVNMQRILSSKKRGRPPKALSDRQYHQKPSRKRARRSYSRKQQIQVLLHLIHHRIRVTEEDKRHPKRLPEGLHSDEPDWRPMTHKEASDWFKIPRGTIAEWWQKRDKIVRRPICRADYSHSIRERYQVFEQALFKYFVQACRSGQKLSRGWFRR
jgi:hypothetical protein